MHLIISILTMSCCQTQKVVVVAQILIFTISSSQAHKQQLLDLRGLRSIALDAMLDLRHISSRYAHSSFARAEAVTQLNLGIDRANSILLHDMRIEKMPQPEIVKKQDSKKEEKKDDKKKKKVKRKQ